MRMPAELIEQLDRWAEAQSLSRSEAMRRLVEIGLKAKAK
jgi:metal-responsive CopG/Arc/MetJ family transcriptional regulator